MALCTGAILRGGKHDFRLVEQLGDKTVFNRVFKAEVMPRDQHSPPKKPWAVVKSANVNDHAQMNSLKREYSYYKQPAIASSRHIRSMYDTINDLADWTAQKPFCLALEWMDTNLADVPSESHSQNSVLMESIFKTVLEAFAELAKERLIYSDLKPANVLISDIDGPSPEVKIGDLGLMGPEGCNMDWLQPKAFRAPEVWTGVLCYHKSDVWSAAAMLMQWLDPGILGDHDNVNEKVYHPMSWCLAKIMLLFEGLYGSIASPPPYVDDSLQGYFQLAKQLKTMTREGSSNELLLQIPSFEEWTTLATQGGVPMVILDVIRLMAIPDPKNRPTALEVLASHEFRALREATAV